MFREEFKRAFINYGFLAAVVVGLLALSQGLSDYLSGPPMTSEYLSKLPLFYNNSYDAFIWSQRGIIGLLGPILAVLPFSDSYLNDRTSGFLRNILSRSSYKEYLFAKYCSTGLSGGFAIAIPMTIFFLVMNIVFPRGINTNPYELRIISTPEALGPFGYFYQNNPDLYIFLLIGLGCIFGMVYAILGLSLSMFIENRYVVLATPFVLFMITHYLLALFRQPAWSPLSALVPHWLIGIKWIHIGISLGGIFLASSIGFFLGSHVKEVRA